MTQEAEAGSGAGVEVSPWTMQSVGHDIEDELRTHLASCGLTPDDADAALTAFDMALSTAKKKYVNRALRFVLIPNNPQLFLLLCPSYRTAVTFTAMAGDLKPNEIPLQTLNLLSAQLLYPRLSTDQLGTVGGAIKDGDAMRLWSELNKLAGVNDTKVVAKNV